MNVFHLYLYIHTWLWEITCIRPRSRPYNATSAVFHISHTPVNVSMNKFWPNWINILWLHLWRVIFCQVVAHPKTYKLRTEFHFGWACTGMPDEQREGLQEELIDIILCVLKRNPQLHYYQGYHDIVVTFLLVLEERLATALVEKLSTHHLRYSLL